jgi:hypothetical protein
LQEQEKRLEAGEEETKKKRLELDSEKGKKQEN